MPGHCALSRNLASVCPCVCVCVPVCVCRSVRANMCMCQGGLSVALEPVVVVIMGQLISKHCPQTHTQGLGTVHLPCVCRMQSVGIIHNTISRLCIAILTTIKLASKISIHSVLPGIWSYALGDGYRSPSLYHWIRFNPSVWYTTWSSIFVLGL